MSLQHLALDGVTENQLDRLITDKIPESRVLEYKAAITIEKDEQKRELLSDITALANTDGGDIVFGISADNGIASGLAGLRNFDSDAIIARVENLLRDSVQPRISGIQYHVVFLANKNHTLVIRVPRSFAAPHMVKHQGVIRFCGRNANGKYDLDVHELRSAFLANEVLADRLKNFRIDRINRLVSGQTPVSFSSSHLIVLHILPVVGARPDSRFSTRELQRAINSANVAPIGSGGYSTFFNFDGPLLATHWGNKGYHSSVQIFRNGFIEAVESQLLNSTTKKDSEVILDRIIPSIAWERYIVGALPGYFRVLATLNLPPPYAVSISLLNVREYEMYTGIMFSRMERRSIDRDHLMTEEILVESPSEKTGKILRPLFNQVWNACGWEESINYNKDGDWYERR